MIDWYASLPLFWQITVGFILIGIWAILMVWLDSKIWPDDDSLEGGRRYYDR